MAMPAKKVNSVPAAKRQTELSVINNPAPKAPSRAARPKAPQLAMVSSKPAPKTADRMPVWAMTALENSRSCTFLCDLDLTIRYANRKAYEILEFMEPNLHRWSDAWKTFSAAHIVGGNLDFLFTDEPLEFRRACDPRNHPYRKQIKTGPCVCDVQVTGIKDDRGELVGYAVDWERITEKLAQDARVKQLMQTLEESTSNTFLCDTKWDVLYANKRAYEIMEFMEPNLHQWSNAWRTFRAKEVVGKTLEWLFTDEPEQFRKASDPRNHPYHGIIRTGPCTCEVTVTSTKDDKGEVTGYAVYWERITERLKQEAQIAAQIEEGKYLAAKIDEMMAATTAIAGGDLNQTIPVEREDAIGKLASAFNSMTQSLRGMAEAADNIARGDLTVQVKPQSERDMLALAFNKMTQSLRGMAEAADNIARGDLTVQVKPQSEKDLLGNAFVAMIQNLSELIAQTRNAADNIVAASGEVATGTSDLSQRTEEQASSLEETASSMEEMTSTVKQNADNARQANQLAAQAREVAEKGGTVVSNAVASMEEINKASKRIADIISVIDEIAFQTNLLALNAAVEAARVGEQGRGFAVVAAEVRSLAGRSATAAKEIKALVADSVAKVHEGSGLVNRSGEQLEEIVTSVKKVADIIAEIAAASQEQSAGIEQVNKAVMQMDQITQQNAALVEEASASSHAVNQQAEELQELVAQFKLDPSYLAALQQQAASKQVRPPASAPAQRRVQPAPASPARAVRAAQSQPARYSTRPTVKQDEDQFEEF